MNWIRCTPPSPANGRGGDHRSRLPAVNMGPVLGTGTQYLGVSLDGTRYGWWFPAVAVAAGAGNLGVGVSLDSLGVGKSLCGLASGWLDVCAGGSV
jgi:hypothetical protein